jgi:hypothetical protein
VSEKKYYLYSVVVHFPLAGRQVNGWQKWWGCEIVEKHIT